MKSTIADVVNSQLPPEPETGIATDFGDDFGRVESVDYEIKTVEQALKRAQVDLAIWEPVECKVGSSQVGMKMRRRHEGGDITYYPIKRTLWRVSVKLRRKIPKNILLAFDALFEKMKGHEPKYNNLPKLPKIQDPHLLEIALFDHHFGKLAWGAETGTDYDMKIAETLYLNAVQDLLVRTQGYPVEKILFPIGQDFFHVDNSRNLTVNDTPQDVDTRYGKMIQLGTEAVIKAVDFLIPRARVEVVWVPGNHDRTTSYHLAREIKAWYRNTDRVTVDVSPRVRKYFMYSKSLIGYTHGDQEPHRDLPTIMASEVPELWAKAVDRVWHIGHFHKQKEVRHTAADSFANCRVEICSSLSGTDAWHAMRGFTGSKRCAEAFLWSKENGYTGKFSVNARE